MRLQDLIEAISSRKKIKTNDYPIENYLAQSYKTHNDIELLNSNLYSAINNSSALKAIKNYINKEMDDDYVLGIMREAGLKKIINKQEVEIFLDYAEPKDFFELQNLPEVKKFILRSYGFSPSQIRQLLK